MSQSGKFKRVSIFDDHEVTTSNKATMSQDSKPLNFVIHFNGKVKHDTQYYSASEKCNVQSGVCMLEGMKWPEAGTMVRVIDKRAFDRVVEALKFYANEKTYNIRHVALHVDGIHAGISSDVHFDNGKTAREALKDVGVDV